MDKITIEQIEEYLGNLAIDVAEGEADAQEVYAIIQTIRKVADPLEKSVKEAAIEVILEHNGDKGPVMLNGFQFTYKQGRKNYSFKHIPEWVEAKAGLDDMQENYKISANKGGTVVDEDTGEIIPPAHIKYAASSLSVKRVV